MPLGLHRDGFDRALIDSIRYEVFGMLLLAAIIGGAAHPILTLFGSGFARASDALVLLALFPALAAVSVTQTQALWSTDRPGRTSLIALVRLLVTIALLIVLTPSMGIVGPAIALLAGYVVVILLSGLALRPVLARPLRSTWPLRERFALFASYALALGASALVAHLVPSVAGLPLCLGSGTAAYLLVLFAIAVAGSASGPSPETRLSATPTYQRAAISEPE